MKMNTKIHQKMSISIQEANIVSQNNNSQRVLRSKYK